MHTHREENQYSIVSSLSEGSLGREWQVVVRDRQYEAPHSKNEEYQWHKRQFKVSHLGFGVKLG